MAKADTDYINRELSWLEFNQRVLGEARDESVPLLERLKFLAITDSNLQEFFMVRVGGLTMLARGKVQKRDPAGLTPAEQLQLLGERTHRMALDQYDTYRNQLEPALAKQNFRRVVAKELTDTQLAYLRQFYEQEIAAVLTPMAVRAGTRFPLLRNLGLHMLVRLAPHGTPRTPRFAVIPVSVVLDRFITLPVASGGYHYILLEDVVRLFVHRLFVGERVAECVAFRITRNADMSVEEDAAADLLSGMREILDARKRSDCVRLEIEDGASKGALRFLKRQLHTADTDVYSVPGPIDLSAFMKLASMEGFDHLRHTPWPPQPSPVVDRSRTMFENIARQDLLLGHPYESFKPVVRLIQEAAEDPDVLAIKQVLYRTSRKSPVIEALRNAAQNGKYVTVIVELKARFDEARNIKWAKQLELDGVQVIYGVKGLKTHAKLCIIVRREARGVVRYLHFGTGNYNELTAKLYSDISYMTTDAALGADASVFFNAITGYSEPQQFLRLAAAPLGMRKKLLELIAAETERCAQDQDALILAKMNSLVDTRIIDALYRASQKGVRIKLNVRGICCLRPGVEGLSENITVTSIIDRYLEHSRIFYFRHGGEEQMFIASADWMPRNLDRRAELLVPVDDPACKKALKQTLQTYFQDTCKSHVLRPDGTYTRSEADADTPHVQAQQTLHARACDAVAEMQQARRTVFEPHRPPRTASS